MIDVRTYVKPHNNGEGGSGGTTIINGGKSSTYNSINVNSINASKGNIDYLNVKSISGNEAQFIYFQTREGQIIKLSGNELKYNSGYIGTLNSDDISSKKITTDELEAINAYIDTLNSREITTEYLTVTKQAHFFELVIDKIKSVGGNIILTPASCIIDYVWGVDHDTGYLVHPDENNIDDIDYFYVFWRTSDDNGRSITNDFIAGDQAYCQSFNNVSTGVNYNVANKYYWRLVKSVGFDYIITDGQWPYQMYVNFSTGELSETENNTEVNQFDITLFNTKTKYKNNSSMYENKIEWKCEAQVFRDADGNPINGIETNVRWQDGERENNEAIHGIFSSASQVYGIEIKPVNDAKQCNVTNYLEFRIRQTFGGAYFIPEKINIGIYFTDDTFKVFNNVNIGSDYTYSITLDDVDAPIEAITIVSAADVNWHLCHCMKLSNIFIPKSNSQEDAHIPAANSERDWGLNNFASTPSEGDNIVQLGYRSPYNDPDDDPELNENSKFNRQNAIIISAYNTIDKGGRDSSNNVIKPILPPSYAQYRGIDDFNLFTHRHTFMDANGATFRGDFIMMNGMTLDDKIKEIRDENYWKNCYLSTYLNNITFVYDRDTTVTTISPTSLDLYIMWYESADEYESRVTVPQGWYVSVRGYYKDGTPTGSYVYQAGASLGTINISNLIHLNLDATNINNLRTLTFTLFKGTDVVNRLSLPIIYTEDAKDGEDGETTEVIKLMPINETLIANYITALSQGGNCDLICNIQYNISQIEGDTITNLNWNNYGLRLTAYNSTFTNIWSWSSTVDGWPSNTAGTYAANNLLTVINPAGDTYVSNDYRDYMKCIMSSDSTIRARCPIYLKAELYDSTNTSKVYDSELIYAQIETNAIFQKTDDKITAAIADSGQGTGVTAEWVTNNFSKVIETAYGFNLQVGGQTVVSSYDASTIDTKLSEINITPEQIEAVIGDDYYTKNEVDSAINNAIGDPNYFNQVLDLYTDTDFDNNKYYPVIVNVGTATNVSENGPMLTCQVDCSLDEFPDGQGYPSSSRPSWGGLYPNDGHNRGVALICNWSVFCNLHGDWNNNEKNVYINTYELKFTRKSGGSNYDSNNSTNEIKVIGGPSDSSGIVQYNGYLIFYLRGGAKYNFRFNWPNLHPTVYKTGHRIDDTHNYPVYNGADSSSLYVPNLDRMWKSQILQEADRISLNVWSGSGVTLPNSSEGSGYTFLRNCGIDIGTRDITLKADKVKFTDTTGNIHDKISIDPTTGTLNATNAHISGDFTFKVTYQDIAETETNTVISSNNIHSFYMLTGPAYESHTVTLPHPSLYQGLQIQFFKPCETTRTVSMSDWDIVTPQSPNPSHFYLKKADGLADHSKTSVPAVPGNVLTFIASGDDWYEVNHTFTAEELTA